MKGVRIAAPDPRQIDGKLDSVAEDVRELQSRTGILDLRYVSISNRIDRVWTRPDRIERR